MNPLAKLALAGGIAVVGLVAVVGLFVGGGGGVRSHLADTYTRAPVSGTDAGTGGGSPSVVYTSPDPPAKVASRIAGAWKPAERINDPGGYFLRYRNEIVAVTSAAGGGSRIFVDDEDRGYARWYPYIGGRWGTFSGRGETFRGGGPGAGK